MAWAACAIQFLIAALLTQSFGAYVALLSEERGWSKTALSGAAALQSVEGAIIGPVLGWLMDRYGAQAMIRLGMLVLGVGLMALGQIDSLGGFYVCAVLMGVGASLGGYFPLSVALIQWFERYRARSLSMVSLGLAVGGLAVPVVAWSMQHHGWRATALASGLLVLAIGVPLASVFKRRPQDYGQTVDGLAPDSMPPGPGDSAAPATAPEFSAREAIRTPAFWLLALGHGLALLVVTAVNVHAISHMKEGLGYTVQQAALVIMLMTGGQVAGVLVGLGLGDRFPKRQIAALCMLAHALGLLLLTYASSTAEVLGFALLHGFAWGLRGPIMQAIRADYFGRNAIGMILGLSAAIAALGQVAGPMVAGILADLSGNYRTGFTVLALLAAAGSVMFLLARPPALPEPGLQG